MSARNGCPSCRSVHRLSSSSSGGAMAVDGSVQMFQTPSFVRQGGHESRKHSAMAATNGAASCSVDTHDQMLSSEHVLLGTLLCAWARCSGSLCRQKTLHRPVALWTRLSFVLSPPSGAFSSWQLGISQLGISATRPASCVEQLHSHISLLLLLHLAIPFSAQSWTSSKR